MNIETNMVTSVVDGTNSWIKPLAVAEDIIDTLGLSGLAEQFGTWPTLLGGLVITIIIAVVIIGGRNTLKKAKETSKADIANRLRDDIEDKDDDEIYQQVNDQESDVLNEATKRLQRRDQDINGDTLKEVLEEIEREEKSEDATITGVLNEPGDRAPTAKMSVAPEAVEEHDDYVMVRSGDGERKYIRTMFISSYPDRVTYGWLDKFFTSGLQTVGADIRVSYHIWPRDPETMMNQLNKQATRLTSTIRRKESEGKINTMEEKQQRERVNQLRDRLSKGSTKLFDFGLYIQIVAQDEERLGDATEEVKQYLSKANARSAPIIDRQLDTYRTMAPLGQDRVKQTQIMDLQSLGTTFPFIEPTRINPNGVLVGFHQTTNSPVIVDRFDLSGHNALVSGKIGSGKSYLTKLMMWRRLMMDPETELLIIDPVGGFGDMVEALGGQSIRVDRQTIINPLEIKQAEEVSADMDESTYDMKIRSVMGMFGTHFEGELQLSKGEEGVLRRAIRYAYLERGITKDPRTHSNESPTIQNVIDILKHMSEGKRAQEYLNVSDDLMQRAGIEDIRGGTSKGRQKNIDREAGYAHQVLLGMEEFTQGGQRDYLNGQTNINMNNRVVQFDLDNIADSNESGLLMHIILDFLFQRAKATTDRTLVTIDEAHYMLGTEGALDALETFARHSRHYNSGMTLISQTVDEFMGGQAKAIYDQCDIRILMRHEDIGDEALDALSLTPPERDFVLSAKAGNTSNFSECLVYAGENLGKRRVRVYSYDFEHTIIDGDAPSVWSHLYESGEIPWEDIPDEQRDVVRREVGRAG